MITRNLHQAGAAACLLMALYASPAQAADIWVSGTGSDLGGDGSSAEPFRTIGRAMVQAVPHDVIKVLSGDYGIADGEVFPIAIKHGVDIIGQEGSPANYPRIGGDVEDGDVRALFEVVADTADRTGILISGLRFVGEDTANEDAPGAIYVENADTFKAWVAVDNCIFDRSRMNSSGGNGRPTILGVAGLAYDIEAEPPEGGHPWALELVVTMSDIRPTDRGGIEINVGPDALAGSAGALARLVVNRCDFELTGSETAQFAIDFVLECLDEYNPQTAEGTHVLSGNTIDARECTSAGFLDGIRLGGEAGPDSTVSIGHTTASVVANSIHGCSDAALRWVIAQSETHSDSNIQCWLTDRNVLTENPGDGVVVDWIAGYANLQIVNCLIAGNDGSGFVIESDDEAVTGGDVSLLNCTIADNASYGVLLDDVDDPTALRRVYNTIVWDNGFGSHSGWDPASHPSNFSNNAYEGWFGL